jgi:hypothetical protein
MIPLEVNRYGYLEMSADAFLDDISTVSDEWTNVFNAYCAMRADADYADAYANERLVREWAESLGTVSGIYGEDGPVSVSTGNMETFLSDDVSFSFLHLEREVITGYREADESETADYLAGYYGAADGYRETEHGLEIAETEIHHDTLIVVTGSGYYNDRAGYAQVREFIGDDDSDAFRYASGYVVHTEPVADNPCPMDWILDTPHVLWPNGGGVRDLPRVEAYILGTFDEDGDEDTSDGVSLYCPECGQTLAPYAG